MTDPDLAMQHVFDLDGTMRRLEGKRHLFEALVEFCYEDSPDLLQQLRLGVERQEPVEVEKAAHSLMGLASNFGAQGLTAAAGRVEEMAVSRDWPAAETLVPVLEQETQRLLEALTPYRPKATRGN